MCWWRHQCHRFQDGLKTHPLGLRNSVTSKLRLRKADVSKQTWSEIVNTRIAMQESGSSKSLTVFIPSERADKINSRTLEPHSDSIKASSEHLQSIHHQLEHSLVTSTQIKDFHYNQLEPLIKWAQNLNLGGKEVIRWNSSKSLTNCAITGVRLPKLVMLVCFGLFVLWLIRIFVWRFEC